MKKLVIKFFLCFSTLSHFGQGESSVLMSDHMNNTEKVEQVQIAKIKETDATYSFKQLAAMIEQSKINFQESEKVGAALAEWLEENHVIYNGKGFNEVQQFRAYLLYSFSFFPVNGKVLKYLKYELAYSDDLNVKGACIYTARKYHDENLHSLVESYNSSAGDDRINFTDYEIGLNYSFNTTFKKEVTATLSVLKTIEAKNKESDAAHSCCSKKNSPVSKIKIVEKNKRRKLIGDISFVDQFGKAYNFNGLGNMPFVFTFFYTSCTNQNKCAATISKLKQLQERAATLKINVGIYAATYDQYIDKPDALKKYGEAYNFKFNNNNKFLAASSDSELDRMNNFFNTKVSYGNGIVNQHGTQLYIYDKKRRIACEFENENWSVENLVAVLQKLNNE